MKDKTQHPEWVKVYWLKFQEELNPVFEKGDLSNKPSKLLEQESLEIINIAQIIDDLQNKDFQSQDVMKEFLEMSQEFKTPEIDPVDELIKSISAGPDKGDEKQKDLVNKIRVSAKELRSIEKSRREGLRDDIEESKKPTVVIKDVGPIKLPILKDIRIKGDFLLNYDEFKKFFVLPKDSISNNPNYENDTLKPLFNIVKALKGLDGDETNTEYELSISRKSDGTFNIIAIGALYNGMILRPVEAFTQIKDQAEEIKMPFNIMLFAKNDVLQNKIEDSISSSAPTPFKTVLSPFQGTSGK